MLEEIIISDLDETLTLRKGGLVQIPQDLIGLLSSGKLDRTVATGRSFTSAQAVLKELKATYPMITEGGAIITNSRGTPIITHSLSGLNVECVKYMLEKYGKNITSISYYPLHRTKNQIAHKAKFYFPDAQLCNDKKLITRYGAHSGESTVKYVDFIQRIYKDQPAQLRIDVVNKDQNLREELIGELKKNEGMHVIPSGNIIHITNAGIHKSSAVKELISLLSEDKKINQDTQLYYIGNGENDVPVFQDFYGKMTTIGVGEEILTLLSDPKYLNYHVESPQALAECLEEMIISGRTPTSNLSLVA